MTATADKGKKAKIDADGGVENEQIDGALVLSIEKLQEVQDELEKVNEEASEKVMEVEQKYSEIRRPVYVRRGEVIKTIPDFWLTAFMSHPLLSELLTEEDQKIFKYLDSVDVDDSDVKSGYSIHLNFSENPYFEDTKLTKTYVFADDGTTTVNATSIKWKEGVAPADANGVNKKGSKRPLVEESFFTWFGDTEHKHLADGVQDEVSEIIKEDLWPNPLKYFNNEIEEEEFEGDDDDEEDLEGDEAEDDEDES